MTLGVLATLASCQKAEVEEVSATDVVSFSSSINQMTRVNGNAFESGDQISVFALEGSSSYAENVMYSYDGSLFASTAPIFYSGSDQLLSFYAIYPYSDAATTEFDFAIATDQTVDAESSDLLVAVAESTNESTPELQFDHKFAKVNVNINDASAEDVDVYVTAQSTVACDVVAGTYSGTGNVAAITPSYSGDDTFSAIVAPQTIYSTGVFITVAINGESYTWVPDGNIELKSGYMYTCNVSVSNGEVIFEGLIESWNDGGDITLESTEDQFTMTLVETTDEDIVVNIDMGEYEGVYVLGISSVSADPTDAAAARIYLEKYYGYDLTTADNRTRFNTAGNKSLKDGWSLYPATNYLVYAVGVDASGNMLTDVQYVYCATPEVYVGGTIALEVVELGARDIKLKGTPTSDVGNYIYAAIEKSEYAASYDSNASLAAYWSRYNMQNTYNIGIAAADGKYVLAGEAEFNCSDIWQVLPETDYVVIVFGVHSTGSVNTEITVMEVTTPALSIPEPEDTMSIEVSKIDILSMDVTIDKGDWEGDYFVAVSDIVYSNPEELAALSVAELGDLYGIYKLTSDNTYVFSEGGLLTLNPTWKLTPYTEYQIIAFGTNEYGDVLTNVASVTERTLPFTSSGSIAVELLELGARDIIVKATPSQWVTGMYVYGLIPTDMYKRSVLEGGFASDGYLAGAAIIQSYTDSGFDFSSGTADGEYILSGEKEFNFRGLWYVGPETDYTLVVCGVQKKGYINTTVTTMEVTTPELVLDDPTDDFSMTLDYASYYNMAVTVDKGSWEGNYYVGLAGDDGSFTSDQQLAESLIEYELYYLGTDFSEADGVVVFDENGQVKLENGWVISPGIDYWIVGFAVNDYGDICSNIVSIHTSTPSFAPEASPASASAPVVDLSSVAGWSVRRATSVVNSVSYDLNFSTMSR